MVAPADPNEERDAGGCYSKLASADDPNTPWTQDVRETEVIVKVTWTACDECKYHMGDGQWDDVEIAFNSTIEYDSNSDEEYEDLTDCAQAREGTPESVTY